ncbi:MAG: DUF4249 domain-containing protein [Bacteroidetes bacterium]|jgi:hypothetical protein|nr:DUF4249 domain-containing protein [Bacteroidota bacterium]
MKRWKYFLLLLAVFGCKKPYAPPVINSAPSYLVIEGSVNSGSDSTFIKLSRTVKLSGKTGSTPELNAVLTVEGDQNTSYPLIEKGKGYYACAGLNLDNTHKYCLDIKTSDGKEYKSDFVSVLDSPPIDSVSFDVNGNPLTGPGMNIYVSTHDATNKVKYFRWDYQETWIFHAHYVSEYYSNGDTVLARITPAQKITYCWASDTSSNIVLGSSAKLTQSKIYQNPVISIPSTSEKFENKYSILVRQYALSEDAYNFYTTMKNNSEELGGIFDVLPSQNHGNLHCITNPSEPVIGYITVGNVASKRIFIKSSQWPTWSALTPEDAGCKLEFDYGDPKHVIPCCLYNFAGENQVNEYFNFNNPYFHPPAFIPLDAIGPPGPIIGYHASVRECADCTLRGTNIAPAFWQ